jgi:exosortase
MIRKAATTGLSLVTRPTNLIWGLAAGSLLWSYWPTLGEMAHAWSHNPHYSHGFLVPVFALALLGLRWKQFRDVPFRPSWWGVPVLLAGVALRLAGTYYYYTWFEVLSLLPCLLGLVLLGGGRPALAWSWPALAFLAFMMPLPYRLETALAPPLRRAATLASTYVLQTLGFPALAEGNTILINDVKIGVVEACSGLSMLVVFFALATGVAFVIRRPAWERVLVVLSAVPVALLANVARITVTAGLHDLVGGAEADQFFHDGAGWFMMPLAVAALWAELRLVAWLFAAPPAGNSRPLAPVRTKAPAAPRARRRAASSPLARSASEGCPRWRFGLTGSRGPTNHD